MTFVRHDDGTFAARLGFGPGVDASLERLRFDERFEPDVFHLAISNSVGIFIEQAQEPKMIKRLPAWYLDAFDDTRAFVLLPGARRHDDGRAAVRRLGRRAAGAQDHAAGDGRAQRARARTRAVLPRMTRRRHAGVCAG
ncbi:hypothetical protein BDAG_02019 [Burkholderia dolosa AU0158]|nr:hypothetical protein BDAG_02019 [Burkholderia dolosa AU0158]